MQDFNILATTMRRFENTARRELRDLLEQIGDPEADIRRTAVSGLISAKTSTQPCEVIEKLRAILVARPYEFRFIFRVIPIEKVVETNLDEIRNICVELASKISKDETFRITVEKRFSQLHSIDVIKFIATGIDRKVDLKNPQWIVLIEIIGAFTGVSALKPNGILSALKEKVSLDLNVQ